MDFILGFGIPIAYAIVGVFVSRATYRSRYKRGLTDYINEDDTKFLCIIMGIIWPLLAPIYYPIVWWGKQIGDRFTKFYLHNLPETDRDKEKRLEREAREAKQYIDKLERELEVGPYGKDLI